MSDFAQFHTIDSMILKLSCSKQDSLSHECRQHLSPNKQYAETKNMSGI